MINASIFIRGETLSNECSGIEFSTLKKHFTLENSSGHSIYSYCLAGTSLNVRRGISLAQYFHDGQRVVFVHVTVGHLQRAYYSRDIRGICRLASHGPRHGRQILC